MGGPVFHPLKPSWPHWDLAFLKLNLSQLQAEEEKEKVKFKSISCNNIIAVHNIYRTLYFTYHSCVSSIVFNETSIFCFYFSWLMKQSKY